MTCHVAYTDAAGSRASVTVADERRPLTRLYGAPMMVAAVTICAGTMTAAAARQVGAAWLREAAR